MKDAIDLNIRKKMEEIDSLILKAEKDTISNFKEFMKFHKNIRFFTFEDEVEEYDEVIVPAPDEYRGYHSCSNIVVQMLEYCKDGNICVIGIDEEIYFLEDFDFNTIKKLFWSAIEAVDYQKDFL